MGTLKNKLSEVTQNKIAHAIIEDVENGMQFHEVVDKYGKTPEIRAEIKEIGAKIEADLKTGKPLKDVLDFHFNDEELKGHITRHVGNSRG